MNIPEVYLAAPDVLGIRFVTGEVDHGRTVAYEPEPGDVIYQDNRWVYDASGAPKGVLAGSDGAEILLFDTFVADAVQADLVNTAGPDAPSDALFDQLSGWTVTVDGQTVQIDDLFRKTKVIESADTGSWPDYGFVQEHIIHLRLDGALVDGATITINPPGDNFETLTATIDTSETRSDSIHVNQNGFDPDHPQKVAFLSTWLGNNTSMAENADNPDASLVYAEGTSFYLVNSNTGERAFEGVIELYRAKTEFSNFAYNYAQADTYVMDFSSFTEEGNFHIEVDGIGTSYEFEISDAAWQNAFELSMRGFYHQRSGIALEEPYTDWERPRSLHPADGQVVYQSTTRLMDTNFGYDASRPDAFVALVAGKTDEVVSEAWGGWHDAGDWDRRAQHLDAVNQMLETFSLNPAYFEKIDLNLPESNNAIPDVIDEALWTIDMFMRLQKADGGVPGGIEHEGHPKDGEASWNNSLETFVYAPDPWSSFKFAASAAKAAVLVEPYDSERAANYLDAAEQAAQWALDNADAAHQNDRAYLDAHNLAAIELYAATGDSRWHDEFLATSSFAQDQALEWNEHQTDAAFAYWQLDPALTDPDVRARIAVDIPDQAWAYVYAWGNVGSFGEAVNPWAPVGWGEGANTPTRAADLLIRAHIITGEQAYLDAVIDETHFGLGANPDNISYTTGIGDEQLREILVEDAVALGSEMPPGITIYGIQDPLRYGTGFWTGLLDSATYPASPFNWPVYETWNGFFYSIPLTEYTVDQGMANSAYVWGYLAQHTNDAPVGDDALVISGTDNDDILVGNGLDNIIAGYAGDDTLAGLDGADTLDGGEGNDWLDGGSNSDIINGGADNDTIVFDAADNFTNLNGGDGWDTLFFYDNWQDLDLAAQNFEQSQVQISDNGAEAWATITDTYDLNDNLIERLTVNDDGTSSLTVYDFYNVETWTDWTRNYDGNGALLSEVFTSDADVIEDNGALQLAVNTGGAYQVSDGAGMPVVLKYGGSDVGPASLAGWSALQAEATATGFTVLWHHTDGRYVVWQTDAAGNYLSSTRQSEASLDDIEDVFAADLNGNGGIGVIENNGAYSLSLSAAGAYQIGNGVGTPVVLEYNGADVGPTTLAGWSAVQAEARDTGFAVLWHHDDGRYVVWQTDAAGVYESSYSLQEGALGEVEDLFATDLNGDSVLAVIEDNGTYQLSVNADGAYQVSDGVGTPVVLEYNGSDVGPTTLAGWSAVQAEARDTGFAVLWHHDDGRYVVWQTDAAGVYESSYSLQEGALGEVEDLFATDLNGDSVLAVIEDNGTYQLSVNADGAYQVSDGVGTPVVLEYNGSDVGPTTLAGWSAVQAEARDTGFAVLWHHDDGRYVVWQTDAAGVYESSYSLQESELTGLETLFAADLDGDGGSGVIEDNGAYQLSVDDDGAYQVDGGVGSPVVLEYNKDDVGPTTHARWFAVQAEATDTGFTVQRQGPNDVYSLWQTYAAGAYQSSSIHSAADLVGLEPVFAADLDGDGVIGNGIAPQLSIGQCDDFLI